MGTHTAAQSVGERLRERNCVALDGDVDVEAGFAEQDVPYRSADEVDTIVGLAQGGDGLEDRGEPLELSELCRERNGRAPGRRSSLPQRLEHVSAGDDAGELAVPHDRDPVVARGQQPLQLQERRLLVAGRDPRTHDSLHRRVREAVRDRLVEVLTTDSAHDFVSRGNEDAVPRERLESGVTRFSDRWNIGQQWKAFRRRHRDGAEPPRVDLRL